MHITNLMRVPESRFTVQKLIIIDKDLRDAKE